MPRYRVGRLGRPSGDTSWGNADATDRRSEGNYLKVHKRLKDGFKLLDQPMDSRYDALYASQDAPGAIFEPRDEGRYYRLCPQHRKPLDPEGKCQGHRPRRWHVAELLQGKSWKILYRDVC